MARKSWARTESSRAIGRRIREERIALGFYRTELAQLVGTTARQLGRWEVGWPISDVRLAKVARQMQRSFVYMKTGKGDPVPREGLPAVAASAEQAVAPDATAQVIVMSRADVEEIVKRAVAEVLMARPQATTEASFRVPNVSKRAGRTPQRG